MMDSEFAQSDLVPVRRRSIVFFGSPLIDVTTNVDDAFLLKYRLEPDNAYVVDETTRKIFDDIRTEGSVQVGGSVTNTVRVFRKLRGYPECLTYLGSIGGDEFGKLIRFELARENLESNLSETGHETGKVAVLLNGTHRTLVTDLGASRHFELQEKMWIKIDASSYVYFSAFFIGVSFATITRVIEKSPKTIILNLGAPFLSTKYPKEMVYLYRNSSIVFGNESEHLAFAKINDITSKDIVEAVISTNRLDSSRSRVCVVTRGGGSVLVIQDSDWREFEVRSLEEERVVDTNGAGDAFVGGFLARYVEDDSVANCVRSGMEVARKVIQSVGFVF